MPIVINAVCVEVEEQIWPRPVSVILEILELTLLWSFTIIRVCGYWRQTRPNSAVTPDIREKGLSWADKLQR